MNYQRRGVVLILVVIVITMLALGGLAFAELMLNEHRAAQTSSRQSQARVFAESGQELARQILDRYPEDIQTAGGLYDNPGRFFKQVVAEDDSPRDRGLFTITALKLSDDGTTYNGVRNGLEDESGKINLAWILTYYEQSGGSAGSTSSGTASGGSNSDESDSDESDGAHELLMNLPGMTDAIADAILDWIDADDTPRENGAESDFYSALSSPYVPRDAPPASIQELLAVEGVTPELLYGLDAAKMGYSSSDSAGGSLAGINTDGVMDHGWAQYLTLWSAESTLKPSDGTPKTNVNQSDMSTLYSQLSAVLDPSYAEFIVCYRQGGGTADSSGHLDTTNGFGTARNTIGSMLDLVGAADIALAPPPSTTEAGSTVGSTATTGGSASTAGEGSTVTLKNPFTTDTSAMTTYLPILFDNCTTVAGTSIPGRININQASQTVLMCIPGMTEEIADGIISSRQPDPASAAAQALPTHTCPAWPLIEGIMTLDEMKAMIPYINAGGSVYKAQIIGHFDKGNPVARLEVILDATQQPARVLFWKDMSHLTGGFPGETGSTATGEH